jgi:hypothetical protein
MVSQAVSAETSRAGASGSSPSSGILVLMSGSQWHRFYAATTLVTRWPILDFSMPVVFRPLRPLITARFDQENLRTMAAVKQYAEAHADDGVPG